MAVIVRGETRCGVCDRTIEIADEVVAFPDFVLDPTDSLVGFSGRAFHLACFEADPLGPAALGRLRSIQAGSAPSRRICANCGKRIDSADQHVLVGWMADPASKREIDRTLAAYNFTHLHTWCVRPWPHRSRLIQALNQATDVYGSRAHLIEAINVLSGRI